MKSFRTLAILTMLPALGVQSGVRFEWVKDYPTRNHQMDAQLFDGGMGFIVGFAGTVLKTADGGATWMDIPNNLRGNLYEAHFLDSLNGLAIEGNNGDQKLYSTRDGGRSWKLHDVMYPYDVHMFKDSTWLLLSGKSLLLTKDGGRRFEPLSVPIPNSSTFLKSMSILNDSVWIATGDYGLVVKTRDGGKTWKDTTLASFVDFNLIYSRPDGRMYLAAEGIHGDNSAYLAGHYYFSADSGGTWKPLVQFDAKGLIKKARYFSPSKAVGLGHDKQVYASEDSGRTWTKKASFWHGGLDYFPSIAMDGAGNALIAGYYGDIFRVSDSGKTVMQVSRRQPAFDAVHFRTPTLGFATGLAYVADSANYFHGIHRSLDGGRTWILATANDRRISYGRKFEFVDSLNGILAGSRNGRDEAGLLRTLDGGKTWEERAPTYPQSLRFASMVTKDIHFVGGGRFLLRTLDAGRTWDSLPWIIGTTDLKDVRFVHPGLGFLLRQRDHTPYIAHPFKTTDLGFNFDAFQIPRSSDLTQLRFFDDKLGFIVGKFPKGQDYQYILRTRDGGLAWDNLNTPVKAELTDIAYAHESTWLAVGRNGAMYYSEDGGETWTYFRKIHSDIVGVQFASPNEGFVLGANGELIAVHIDKEQPSAARSHDPAARLPRPAFEVRRRRLQVSLPALAETITVSIHGLDGRRAAGQRFLHRQTLDMDVGGLEAGTYLIRVSCESRTFTGKVLIP